MANSATFVSLCVRILFFFSSLFVFLSSFFIFIHILPCFPRLYASLRSHVDLHTKGMTIAIVVAGTATSGEISSRSSVWIWTNIRTIVFGSLLPSVMEVNLDFRDKSAVDRRTSFSLFLSLVVYYISVSLCATSPMLFYYTRALWYNSHGNEGVSLNFASPRLQVTYM